ncbi:ribosomal protein L7/L12 [Rhodococcus sp. ACT016]|uniref:ribosomal protein L7/L12 n=1 Tax=Rhodococcus sp. ACT016 TaxID=3134808 RepID=UPI003D2E6CF0
MLRWLEREPVQRWAGTLFLAWFVVLIGPSAVDRMTSEPSAWDWAWLGIVVFALAVSAVSTVRAWRNRNEPRGGTARVAPADVPVGDVRAAIASTFERISAIKALREMHPGLGLRDAKDLVESQPPYR